MTRKVDSAELKKYLTKTIHPVIEPLIVELLKHKPSDIYDFIIQYMQQQKELHQKEGKLPERQTLPKFQIIPADKTSDSEGSEESDDEDDEETFNLAKAKHLKNKPRASVSAEVYGAFNKKEEFQARVIPKTEEQKARIIERLSKAFMFASLDEKEKGIVVSAMEEKSVKAEEWIIRQGEDGNELYVLEEGKLECYKQFSKGEEAKLVKTYVPGESFGELALLYNAPRAASIKALTDAKLYALDRPTFNNIVKDAEVKRRERFEEILGKIELLGSMDPYERSKIADAAVIVKYKAGDSIIRQGEPGDKFYFIEDGTAEATKVLKGKEEAEKVYNYREGDYFGELALLKDEPRAANIIATSDITLLGLDRESFTRVLGPLTEILKRNTTRYEKFL